MYQANYESIDKTIYLIRGHKVMLSHDLARLYCVPTKALLQAVRRNADRFPKDFMFQLTLEEALFSRSQFVTLKNSDYPTDGRGENIKYLPYAFTEQGVAMLSSILRSKKAIRTNIAIMRAFVKLRGMLSAHNELARKFKELESKIERHNEDIQSIFDAIRQLMAPPPEPTKRRIGFRP